MILILPDLIYYLSELIYIQFYLSPTVCYLLQVTVLTVCHFWFLTKWLNPSIKNCPHWLSQNSEHPSVLLKHSISTLFWVPQGFLCYIYGKSTLLLHRAVMVQGPAEPGAPIFPQICLSCPISSHGISSAEFWFPHFLLRLPCSARTHFCVPRPEKMRKSHHVFAFVKFCNLSLSVA